jgi:hypothetical protein
MDTSSANLVVEGDNLDGPRTVLLTGKSVGLTVVANDIVNAGATTESRVFACSYSGNCTIDLGQTSLTNTTIPVILTAMESSTGNLKLDAKLDDKDLNPDPLKCKAIPFANLPGNLQCRLTPTFDPQKSDASLVLTANDWIGTIHLLYQTDKAVIAINVPEGKLIGNEGEDVKVPLTVTSNSSRTALSSGSVAVTESGKNLSLINIATLTGGQADLGVLPVGTHALEFTYPTTGSISASESQSVSVVVRPKANIAVSGPTDRTFNASGPGSVTVSVIGSDGKPCTGHISSDAGSQTALSGGMATITLDTSAAPPNKSIKLSYAPSEADSCAPAQDFTYDYRVH